MASARLRKLAGTIFSEYNSSRRKWPALNIDRTFSSKSGSLGHNESEVDPNAPLKFTGSEAQAWKARQTRSGNDDGNMLWYQPYVIAASLSVFMIYFCVLREENDVDRKFDLTLYDHIEGLEEKHIEQALEYNRKHGIETAALEARLKEIRGQ